MDINKLITRKIALTALETQLFLLQQTKPHRFFIISCNNFLSPQFQNKLLIKK